MFGKNRNSIIDEDVFQVPMDLPPSTEIDHNTEYEGAAPLTEYDELLDEDSVRIICPECSQSVVIGSDNTCPNCGCEFEEIQKKFRLTKLGLSLGIISGVIYIFASVFLRFINNPQDINEDSLFFTDAFINGKIEFYIASIIIAAITIVFFAIINIYENRFIVITAALSAVFLSLFNIYLLLFSEGAKSFDIVIRLIFLLPLTQLLGGLCCFIDMFITPKSKL